MGEVRAVQYLTLAVLTLVTFLSVYTIVQIHNAKQELDKVCAPVELKWNEGKEIEQYGNL
jgi:uncharacterized membrane protein YjfL (UPF0719 family)